MTHSGTAPVCGDLLHRPVTGSFPNSPGTPCGSPGGALGRQRLLLHGGAATRNWITVWQEGGRPDGAHRPQRVRSPGSLFSVSAITAQTQWAGSQAGTWGTFSEKNLMSYFPFYIFFLKSQFGWLKTAVKSLVFFCTYFLQEQFEVRWGRKEAGQGSSSPHFF